MEKRLSKYDILFSLLFIFMLILSVGAFFYGMDVGRSKSDAQYADIIKQHQELSRESTAYEQRLLVSFYHTIFLPNREFQHKWFEQMDTLSLNSSSTDPTATMKQLSGLANEKFKEIESMTMPDSSPLLQQAHQNYLKSLKLFADAGKKMQSEIKSVSKDKLVATINQDAYFEEAINFALLAQHNFFNAIVSWNGTVDADLSGYDLPAEERLSVEQWHELNLNLKNAYVAGLFAENRSFGLFYPQDAVSRIDDMIATGQVDKLGLTDIPQIINMLVDTGGIRSGDFLKSKNKLYIGENLPQLPFFTSSD